jgi:hypothetical protein
MKAERLILSFIALIIGLGVAGLAFYFYQMTKTIPDTKLESQSVKQAAATPTPNEAENFLVVENPSDDAVVTSRTITISGRSNKDATLVINTESEEQVVKPALNGNFSLTQSIDEGANFIQITAILPDGREERVYKTVTFSTESF